MSHQALGLVRSRSVLGLSGRPRFLEGLKRGEERHRIRAAMDGLSGLSNRSWRRTDGCPSKPDQSDRSGEPGQIHDDFQRREQARAASSSTLRTWGLQTVFP